MASADKDLDHLSVDDLAATISSTAAASAGCGLHRVLRAGAISPPRYPLMWADEANLGFV